MGFLPVLSTFYHVMYEIIPHADTAERDRIFDLFKPVFTPGRIRNKRKRCRKLGFCKPHRMLDVLTAVDKPLIKKTAFFKRLSGIETPSSDKMRPARHRVVAMNSDRSSKWSLVPVTVRVKVQVLNTGLPARLDVSCDSFFILNQDVIFQDEEPVTASIKKIAQASVFSGSNALVYGFV